MAELKLTYEQALGLVRFVKLLNREIKNFDNAFISNEVEPLRWDPDKPDKYRPGSGKRIFPKPKMEKQQVKFPLGSDVKMTEDTKASVFKTALYYMQMAEIAAQNKCEYLSKHFLKRYGEFEERILFSELEEDFMAYVACQNGGKKHGI